jgi:tetratricopeptide (TPR) repeat protein
LNFSAVRAKSIVHQTEAAEAAVITQSRRHAMRRWFFHWISKGGATIQAITMPMDRHVPLILLYTVLVAALYAAAPPCATALEQPPVPPSQTGTAAPLGDQTEAVSSFDKTPPMSDSATEAVKHNDLGVAFVFRGDREQAVDEFKHALRLEPNYFAAYLNLANTLVDLGRHEEAVVQFHEALRLKPADPKAHNDLGVALKSRGDFRGAAAEFQTVLGLRPDDVHAHNNLGVALKAMGDMNGAIAEYKTAIRLQPSDINAHYNVGLAMMETGNMEAAVEEFRTALHLRPNDGGIRFNLGTALAKLGKRAEAAHEFQQYLRLELDTPANRRWIEQAETNLRELESR